MDAVGVERAFDFLKATSDATRRAAERRLEAAVQLTFDDFADEAYEAVEAGQQPDYRTLSDALMAAFVPFFASQYTEQALRVSAEVGIGFDPAIINTRALEWARTYSFKEIGGLIDTTRKVVRDAISAFIETPGMTQGDIAEMLEGAFGEARARAISITETTRAYSMATNQIQVLVNETGLEMVRTWGTRNDELVCPICGPLNQQPEIVWRAQFPDGPPAHPHCRCGESLTARPIADLLRDGIDAGRQRLAMFEESGDVERITEARESLRIMRERVRGRQ